ncbi:MAG: TonB family protein [Candidatus Longimicrobiales bacterium M2_2A_002]
MPPLGDLAGPGTRGNLSLATADFEAADSVTLSVRYDDEGRLAWVRPIASSVGPERTASIESVLFDSVIRDGPANWGFRLEVSEDRAGVLPSVVCPVRIRQGVRRPVYPPRTLSARAAVDRLGGLPVELVIAVDERGRVVHVRLPRSTGDRGLDQYLIESVMEIDFFPRTHDGVPIPSTIRRSIRIPRAP